MIKQTREFLERVKEQMLDAASRMSLDEREEFYNDLLEWAYGQYEEALICQEVEMQDYEEE